VRTTPEAKAEELLAKHGPLLAMDVAHGRLRAHEAEVRRDPCPAAGRTLAFWAAVVGELRRRERSGPPLSRAKRRRLRERKAAGRATKQ
jgi:hypothetical protein